MKIDIEGAEIEALSGASNFDLRQERISAAESGKRFVMSKSTTSLIPRANSTLVDIFDW
jgi:hypothetical protein